MLVSAVMTKKKTAQHLEMLNYTLGVVWSLGIRSEIGLTKSALPQWL